MKKYRLILASGSQRRQELLSKLGIDYTVRLKNDIKESYPADLNPENIPVYISKEKAMAYIDGLADDELLLTADTIVCLDGQILGKPKDKDNAKRMLQMLSDNTHKVITGVCLTTKEWQQTFYSVTEVCFDCLSEKEIDYYIAEYEPLDKAGAYGIQEYIGYIGVKSIEGSYFNVIGLPVQRLYRELREIERKYSCSVLDKP